VEHLSRVAALVTEAGGGARELTAAWLHGVTRTGTTPRDLAVLGVPAAAIQIIEAVGLDFRWLPAAPVAARVQGCPGATVVLQAVIGAEYLGRTKVPVSVARRDAALLTALGLPVPAKVSAAARQKPAHPQPASPAPAAAPEELRADAPDRFRVAARLAFGATSTGLRALIAAYVAAASGNSAWNRGPGGKAAQSALGNNIRLAVHASRNGPDPDWVAVLLEMAGHDEDLVRAMGIRGLGRYTGYDALIERALSDDRPPVVEQALAVLRPDRVGGTSGQLAAIGQRLGPEWRQARFTALKLLAEAEDPGGRDALLAAVAVSGRRAWRQARELIAANDPAIIPALMSQLSEGAPGRAGAALILGEMRASEAVPVLAAALTEALDEAGAHRVIESCALALAKIGGSDPAGPSALRAAYHRFPGQADLRIAMLAALGHFDSPLLTETALEAADDRDPGIRERAIRLLAARGDERSTTRLLIACDGPLATIALRGLLRLADERSLPTLVHLLATATDRQVLHLAGRAMVATARGRSGVRFPYTSRLPSLRAWIWVRGEIGTTHEFDQLAGYLTHRDELVRARTAAALGKIGDPAPAEKLARALTDISPRVRASAATALGKVVPGADAGLADQARNWLAPLRNDAHPSVRTAATAALGRISGPLSPA